jgi:hypothetical protein
VCECVCVCARLLVHVRLRVRERMYVCARVYVGFGAGGCAYGAFACFLMLPCSLCFTMCAWRMVACRLCMGCQPPASTEASSAPCLWAPSRTRSAPSPWLSSSCCFPTACISTCIPVSTPAVMISLREPPLGALLLPAQDVWRVSDVTGCPRAVFGASLRRDCACVHVCVLVYPRLCCRPLECQASCVGRCSLETTLPARPQTCTRSSPLAIRSDGILSLSYALRLCGDGCVAASAAPSDLRPQVRLRSGGVI